MIEIFLALIIWMAVFYFDVWSHFDSNGSFWFNILMVLLVISDPAIKIIKKEEKKT